MQRTPYTPIENALPIHHYQACIKEVYTLKSQEAFDEFIANYLVEYPLTDKQLETIDRVITGQRKLFPSTTGTPVTVASMSVPLPTKEEARIQEISQEYKEVDEENFPPIDIQVSGGEVKPMVVNTPSYESEDPLDMIPSNPTLAESVTEVETVFPDGIKTVDTKEESEATPKKRTRRTKEEIQEVTPINSVKQSENTITLKRRINLPIDGVQYSNNEYGCEVTASSKEEAQSLLEEIMADFIQSSGLVRSSSIEAQKKASYDQGFQAGVKSVPPAPPVTQVRSPEDDLEIRRFARIKLFMGELAKDQTILASMNRVKAEFEKTNPKF